MSQSDTGLFDSTKDLLAQFPEAKLTMRDRLPTAMILTAAYLDIRKSISNIKYSDEELREGVMGLVALIPDGLRDNKFYEEMAAAKRVTLIDCRPQYCGVRASEDFCRRKGLPLVQKIETFDYLEVLHATVNLLMRAKMLLRIQPKEIFTGLKARGEDPDYESAQDNKF